jgi:hypothetical protein
MKQICHSPFFAAVKPFSVRSTSNWPIS